MLKLKDLKAGNIYQLNGLFNSIFYLIDIQIDEDNEIIKVKTLYYNGIEVYSQSSLNNLWLYKQLSDS